MLVSSLAVFALAASTAVSPVSKSVHLHTAQLDSRIHVTLHNDGRMFQDVKVDGRSYTIIPHHGISIKAPAGHDHLRGQLYRRAPARRRAA